MLTISQVAPEVETADPHGAKPYIAKPAYFGKFTEVATQIELYCAVLNTGPG